MEKTNLKPLKKTYNHTEYFVWGMFAGICISASGVFASHLGRGELIFGGVGMACSLGGLMWVLFVEGPKMRK